jgi:hypothetical protein
MLVEKDLGARMGLIMNVLAAANVAYKLIALALNGTY